MGQIDPRRASALFRAAATVEHCTQLLCRLQKKHGVLTHGRTAAQPAVVK